MRNFLLLIFALFLHVYATCQNINPIEDEVFRMNEVATIRLTMSAEDKQELIFGDHPELRQYFPATIRFSNSLLDTTVANVGVRNRGNTSIGKEKRPLKIDFREFGGVKFFDHKKFNLKAEHNDPSMLREYISLYILRASGVPAASASFARVYINSEYMGLYLNIEQVDDEFLDRRFDNDSGNLYKCLYQGDPADLRNPSTAYENNRYELKTNEELNDRAKLVAFMQVLENRGNDGFPDQLVDHFQVDRFLRYMAVEALLGHWDGPTMNPNNYYLYEDTIVQKTVLLPYDLDNTLGIDWLGRDWSEVSYTTWSEGHWKSNALSLAVGEVPEFQERYLRYIVTITEYVFNQEHLFPILDSARELIREAVSEDAYYPKDFGFIMDDFEQAFETARGGWLDYGVKPFIRKRIQQTSSELGSIEGFDTLFPNDPFDGEHPVGYLSSQMMKKAMIYPNPCTDYVMVRSPGAIRVEIYSIDGKMIRSESLRGHSRISVSEMKSGLYIIKIYDEDSSASTDVLVVE